MHSSVQAAILPEGHDKFYFSPTKRMCFNLILVKNPSATVEDNILSPALWNALVLSCLLSFRSPFSQIWVFLSWNHPILKSAAGDLLLSSQMFNSRIQVQIHYMTSTSATDNARSGRHARSPAFVLPLLMDVAHACSWSLPTLVRSSAVTMLHKCKWLKQSSPWNINTRTSWKEVSSEILRGY